MRNFTWTRALIILSTVLVALILVCFVLWLVLHFISDLLILFMAAIVAYVLSPAVEAVQRRAGLPRPVAILAIYLALVLVAAGLGALFVQPITEQVQGFQTALPGLLQQLDLRSTGFEQFLRSHGLNLPIRSVTNNAAGALSGASPTVLGGALNLLSSIGTGLVDAVLVAVVAFYLANDSTGIGRSLSAIIPPRYAPGAAFVARSAGTIIGRYVRAQLAVAVMVGLLGGLGSAILGVRYAPLIGIFAFLAESIPVLGPILATIPAVLIALLDSPWKALAILIWFIVIQQLEQNVIMPRLSGHAVGIHPAAAIMAVLIGYDLGSFWGALFAVPVLGFVVALAREAWRVWGYVPLDTVTEEAMPEPAPVGGPG